MSVTLERDTETQRHHVLIEGRRVGWVRYTTRRSWPCLLKPQTRAIVIAAPLDHLPRLVDPSKVRDPSWWAQFTQEQDQWASMQP